MERNQRSNKKNKLPWPTKEAMAQIYRLKLWGDNGGNYFSGEGSHCPNLVEPYITLLTSFLNSFDPKLTVCDLGCGDFNIGKRLVHHSEQYFAVDIVPELIAFNQRSFKMPNLEFLCLDIAQDSLPAGDCAILRQVLQHLSNAEVQRILDRLGKFKYLVLTEHIPEGNFEPNKDIISGQGIRLKRKSGLRLSAHPFAWDFKNEEELLILPSSRGKGFIVTTLYTMW